MENKSDNRGSQLQAIFQKGDGVGFHQLKGQPKRTIRKGDIVKCPPNVEHWHGASQDTGLQQMYILQKTDKGIVQWLQPVTDEEYNRE
ncbi:MAG TPA: hypothetical protein VGD17_15835 [Chitinophagaceae bacterium]